jgi:predicted nucleotidyltransferase
MRPPSLARGWFLVLALSLIAFAGSSEAATTFTDVGAVLQGVRNSSVAWGDYDNDGDLDMLVTGYTGTVSFTRLYRNNGGTFTDSGISLPAIQSGSVAFGDYDGDGYLDILIAGFGPSGSVTKLYHNSGGANPTFTDSGVIFPNLQVSSVAFGDYDNDGDLDLLITGADDATFASHTILYRNNGGPNPTFTDVGAGLDNVQEGSVAFGDYDNDGNLDILITGYTGATNIAKLYRNSGGPNPTFTEVGAGLTGVQLSSVAFGDYDNDGDLDILITGFTGSARIAKLYRNSGGANPTFTDIGAGLTGVNSSSVAFGDYDNDGNLDILLTGFTGTTRVTKLYKNSGGANPTFSEFAAGLVNVQSSSVAWGDYDNDGDLDLLITGYDPGNINTAKLYRNDGTPTNTPPNVPTGLAVAPGVLSTTFSWVAPTDAQTPQAALTYNLRVGTTPGGNDVFSSMASATGYRRLPQLGNTQERKTCTLRLPQGTYYYSVQAIDGAFAGSNFAPEQSFTLARFTPQTTFDVFDSGTAGAWGDYDNDGDLDVLLTGHILGIGDVSRLYRNDGGGTFTQIPAANLLGIEQGSVAWGDYDNDGRLDILMAGFTQAGQPVTKLYHNNGDDTFTDEATALPGVSRPSVAWGDYDNDGDLDILITGNSVPSGQPVTPISRIYRNDGGGVFTDIGAGLPGVYFSSAAWGDFDNDGDLDLALAGSLNSTGTNLITRIYRNDGNGVFTDIGAGLTGVELASLAWGDYDNDGDLDLLVTGIDASSATFSKIYRNDGGGIFTPTSALPNGSVFSGRWGDYDNDGFLDVLGTGPPGAVLYRSSGGPSPTFSFVYSLMNATWPVEWGDYDNDGDLDALVSTNGTYANIYRNEQIQPNAPPSPPSNLSAIRNGGLVTFSWTGGSDDHTPASGLSYNLRVGSSPGGDQNVSAMAGATGYRRVPRLGNAQERTS